MNDVYAGYSYRRYRRKMRVFPFVLAVAVLATVFFVINLFAGFINFRGTHATITAPAVIFYTTQSPPFQNKSEAISKSVTVKESGGAAYLLGGDLDEWVVIDEIGVLEILPPGEAGESVAGREYKTDEVRMKLTRKDDAAVVTELLGSFGATFGKICEYIENFTAGTMTQEEIASSCRVAYNNLLDLTGELERIQLSAASRAYSKLIVYLTRELLGLNLVWCEASSANFLHVLRNAACWVIFAYVDLVGEFR